MPTEKEPFRSVIDEQVVDKALRIDQALAIPANAAATNNSYPSVAGQGLQFQTVLKRLAVWDGSAFIYFPNTLEVALTSDMVTLTGSGQTITSAKVFNPSVTAASGVARGTYYTPTLTAAANGDVLAALDINPTFTPGAFTGTSSLAIRHKGNIVPSGNTTYDLGSISLSYATVWASTFRSISSFKMRSGAGTIEVVGGADGLTRFKFMTETGNLIIQHAAGTFTDVASCTLQINSTTKGVMIPRMTTAQRDAIASPQEGLEVFNITTHGKDFYNGTSWNPVNSTKDVVYSHVQLAHTGTTSETTVFTGTIPASSIGANGRFKSELISTATSNANVKTIRVKFNGTTVWQSVMTSTASNRFNYSMSNRNATNIQIVPPIAQSPGFTFGTGTGTAISTFAFDTTADITVTITVTLATGTDTVNLEDFFITAVY